MTAGGGGDLVALFLATKTAIRRDMVRTARIDQAGSKLISDPKPLFDLPQRQDAAIRRQEPAVEFHLDRLARNG